MQCNASDCWMRALLRLRSTWCTVVCTSTLLIRARVLAKSCALISCCGCCAAVAVALPAAAAATAAAGTAAAVAAAGCAATLARPCSTSIQ
eukprot:21203-Heterococcus_DN1.PRE.3